MPMPVSATSMVTRLRPLGAVAIDVCTTIRPSWVNFTALEMRFDTHWRTRTGS